MTVTIGTADRSLLLLTTTGHVLDAYSRLRSARNSDWSETVSLAQGRQNQALAENIPMKPRCRVVRKGTYALRNDAYSLGSGQMHKDVCYIV